MIRAVWTDRGQVRLTEGDNRLGTYEAKNSIEAELLANAINAALDRQADQAKAAHAGALAELRAFRDDLDALDIGVMTLGRLNAIVAKMEGKTP